MMVGARAEPVPYLFVRQASQGAIDEAGWKSGNDRHEPPVGEIDLVINHARTELVAASATGSRNTGSGLLGGQGIPDFVKAANDDLTPIVDDAEYLEEVRVREQRLEESAQILRSARDAIAATDALLSVAVDNLSSAWFAFNDVEISGDRDSLTDAWSAVRSALDELFILAERQTRENSAVEDAENAWERNSIWLEKYKNDYEGQSNPFAVRDEIARCATSDCSAASFLDSEKFNVFQPTVLEMIGVHHAYAKGLTGRGIRIGIEDTIVNYRLPEFAERVNFYGAKLTYPLYGGDEPGSDATRCEQASETGRDELKCQIISYSSENDFANILDTLTARWAVANYGWPEEGGNWFIRNDAIEEGDVLRTRWATIPHATILSHGTTVASVAAGRDFGVAPGATIVPLARNFDPDAQQDQRDIENSFHFQLRTSSPETRQEWDSYLAGSIEFEYSLYDVINRSFGIGVFDPTHISAILDDESQWWGEGLRQILPETWRAYMQTGTDPDERTIVVYATGNQTQEYGGLGADIPYYEPHVRGSQLAVMAIDHEGIHADYTNFCGPLPPDWNAGRWGRHYCLAAPGTVNAVGSRGRDYIFHETTGTSFAAPVVTGAIALLMEHFRGQLGNTEIVKRIVNTANNEGRYSQIEIYGAGLLDLEAALSPVGGTTTGTPSQTADTAATLLSTPPAIGNLGRRLAASGVEFASVDSLGAPFWSSPERFVIPLQHRYTSPIPAFASVRDDVGGRPHLGFTPGTVARPVAINRLAPSFEYISFSPNSRGQRVDPLRHVGHSRDGLDANALHLLTGVDSFGAEYVPANGIRWGILADGASWLGGGTAGAFGNDVESTTSWIGNSASIEVNDMWTVNASATVGFGQVNMRPGAMFDADTYATSTWTIGLEQGIRGQGRWSSFAISQPLRAETGSGTFTYLAGLERGRPYYDQARVPLEPEGRELELSLTHEAPAGWGRGVAELAYSSDFRHERGESNWRVGVAFRMSL